MEAKNDNYPWEIKDLEPKEFQELRRYFPAEFTGYIRIGPKGYFYTHRFREDAAKIYNMSLRPDDIFVNTFPRSGTTWTQELVWMVANDLDYKGSDATPLVHRFPYLEFLSLLHPVMIDRLKQLNKDKLHLVEELTIDRVEYIARMPSPRFVKTHLPLSLLPPTLLDTAKVVYVARDPRDAAVSLYHLCRLVNYLKYDGDFKTYWDFFVKDMVLFTSYFEHLKEAWENRHHPNMLFLFYEDMRKDLPAAVRKVAKFLNKEYTEEQIAGLCDHLSFDNFKKNKSVVLGLGGAIDGVKAPDEQSFIRKGKSGGWRDYFDEEMMQQADTWIRKNLRDTDFPLHIWNL
ncbi:sulfotransferase domain-containing protein [Phthorimaea operculella]|nr:sulfotransferase domain-containing protein [Phthorimaea operculella]